MLNGINYDYVQYYETTQSNGSVKYVPMVHIYSCRMVDVLGKMNKVLHSIRHKNTSSQRHSSYLVTYCGIEETRSKKTKGHMHQ